MNPTKATKVRVSRNGTAGDLKAVSPVVVTRPRGGDGAVAATGVTEAPARAPGAPGPAAPGGAPGGPPPGTGGGG